LTLKALERAGNPERQAPVFHLAGTSGKGSTATTIARILEAASYRTLLHTSPYLQVSTEKLVVDAQLIDAGQFADLVEAVLSQERGGRLRYGEAWLLLIAEAIARYRPDVAIIETGAGGTWDLTNLIWSEVAVITSVGLDHTETLGNTIREIARHKAGIIKQGASVVHSVDDPDAVAEILAQAQAREAKVEYVGQLEALNVRPERDNHWSWRDPLTGERLVAGLPGKIQARNAALAVAAARAWRSDLPIEAIRAGLASTRFPARFERMPGMQTVILDGAHNPQKVAALIPEIARLPRPRVGVLGFLAAKRADEMMAQLAPHLDEIVLTSPPIVGKPALDVDLAMTLARSLTQVPISGRAVPLAALDLAIERAGAEGSVVVTGSLYLCGAIRERWYASEEIITQRTQWPSA
jgi:dihydrofolate synthase/folylpolyglutamate synthase